MYAPDIVDEDSRHHDDHPTNAEVSQTVTVGADRNASTLINSKHAPEQSCQWRQQGL